MTEAQPAARPEVHETHVSYVFLVGDRGYKLKKPIRTAFLDFSTADRRLLACRRELELNRRLAPDVYLGVNTIVGERGEPLDHLVVMRRMRDEERLSRLLAEGADVDRGLRQVARQLAGFHARMPTSPAIAGAGSPEAVRRIWDQNFEEMRSFSGSLVPEAGVGEAQRLVARYLDGRVPLLRSRMTEGLVRDGHGDLLAGDIFFTADGPRVLDCLEFDDQMRYGDVVLDIAFLAMDLEHRGRPREARRFLDHYREAAGVSWPGSLEHHYVAYRALVRCKVACLREQEGMPGAREARSLLDLCVRHLRQGRVRLVLVGGEPGTGKSTLARRLGESAGLVVLRSDEIRKDLAGVPHTTSLGDRAETWYAPDATAATYAELLRRARVKLEQGESVVLDASWSDARRREEAAELGRQTSSDLLQLRCQVPAAIADARLRARVG
ncbi:MAG: AAA family ATPase, partial [Candidatus Dormibacteraeota bacterium]|nr:AAA family ATPase [Candidatus Dormibacteraeota bacterium]